MRIPLVAAAHLSVWIAALALAHAMIGEPWPLGARALGLLALFLGVKLLVALSLGSFRELWRHTSLEDLASLLEASALAALALALACGLWPRLGGSLWLVAVDAVVTVAMLAPLRIGPRFVREVVRPALGERGRAVVLAGRADLLDLELRRRQRHRRAAERVVGLVVDGPELADTLMRRVPVLGWPRFTQLLSRGRIAEVIVAPPASASFTADLERLCNQERIPCRPAASLLALRELERDPRPLLPRAGARIDGALRREMLSGRRVLITGAGGSIGSELARQLAALDPAKLILVERSENALFSIEQELEPFGCPLVGRILDVRDPAAVQRLFAATRPEMVFHAAAHKHVPMMERHPVEAVLNNVIGTRVVGEAADGFGARSFVFISTDKAVRPSSVMGATKRLAERWVRGMAGRSGTRFVAVRFGNVLGSSGSVLPIFIRQIQRGGPVTVTHPEMRRFFMSIPEACGLVLEAAAMGEGGETFVLDMGEPVRIVDLARGLIERAGLRPGEDVAISFSGVRPGEKLSEELTFEDETIGATERSSIFRVKGREAPWDEVVKAVDALQRIAAQGDEQAVRERLAAILPEYRPERDPREEERREDEQPLPASALH